jgi:predicted HD superfamily hydrolase involved in NAD metabolism
MTFDEQIKLYEDRLTSCIKKSRLEHCQRVAAEMVKMAAFWQKDENKAFVAGLLHDVARYMPPEDMIKTARAGGIHVGAAELLNPVILHAPVGAYILARDWGIKDLEVLAAVSGHTIAYAGMDTFSQLLYIADVIEPERTLWPELAEIRRLAYLDLDLAMAETLISSFAWLKKRGIAIHPTARRAYKYFRMRAKKAQ